MNDLLSITLFVLISGVIVLTPAVLHSLWMRADMKKRMAASAPGLMGKVVQFEHSWKITIVFIEFSVNGETLCLRANPNPPTGVRICTGDKLSIAYDPAEPSRVYVPDWM